MTRRLAALLFLGVFLIGSIVGALVHKSGILYQIRVALFPASGEVGDAADYRPPDLPEEMIAATRSLGFEVSEIQTPDQFLAWQEELLAAAEHIFAVDWCCQEQRNKLAGETEHKQGYTRQRVVLESPTDELDIVYYRLIPDAAAGEGNLPTAGVLVIPGSGVGVADVLGEIEDYQEGIAVRLAEAGYVVYAMENLGWGERSIDPGTQYYGGPADALGINSVQLGKPVAARYVRDARTVLQELYRDPLVDPNRVGVVGCSLGGRITVFVSALEGNRVAATVVASGLTGVQGNPSPSQFIVPGMLEYFDAVDIAAAIAPRPLLLTYGAQDASGPYHYEYETSASYNRLQSAWEITGQPGSLELKLHPRGHNYDLPGTIEFLDRHLKDVP